MLISLICLLALAPQQLELKLSTGDWDGAQAHLALAKLFTDAGSRRTHAQKALDAAGDTEIPAASRTPRIS